MSRVIATAWSRDGSRLYMRAMEFRGHDRDSAELIYIGVPRGGRVQMIDAVALRQPCDCGMCSFMERALDREFPPRRRRDESDDYGWDEAHDDA